MSRAGERLYEAVWRGDVTEAAEWLTAGASPNHARVDRWDSGVAEEPVLYLACKYHDLAMVELLLAYGAHPDAAYEQNSAGYYEYQPCLHVILHPPAYRPAGSASIPVEPRTVEIARLLLEKGANPRVSYRNRDDSTRESTVLDSAAGNPELVALLERFGARG